MENKPTVVFDTNIYISAIIFGGNPRRCLDLARNKEITLVASKAIFVELAEKLREKFLWEEEDISDAIEGLLAFVKLVVPQKKLHVVVKDPPDNRILEAGVEAKADFIVSGDKKHLLSRKMFKSMPIVSSKEFLDRFYGKNN